MEARSPGRGTGAAADHTFLQAVLQTADCLIVVLDADGIVVTFNAACERLTGWSAVEVVGRPFWATSIVDEEAEVLRHEFRRMQDGRRTERFVNRWISRDGRRHHISWSNAVLRDATGAATHVVGTGIDVTERTAAEAALERNERTHRALLEHASDVLAVVDEEGVVRYASPSTSTLLGGRPEAFVGRPALDLLHPDDVDAVAEALSSSHSAPGLKDPEQFRLRRDDGTWVWVEAVANNQLAEPTVAGIVLVLRDVTARRHAEDARRQADERFSSAFAIAPIGMALVSLEGSFLQVNPALCRLLDRDERRLLDSRFHDVTHPDDLDGDLVQIGRLVHGEIPTYRTEKRYLRPDGSVVWGTLNVALVHDPDGRPGHLVAMVEDITARRAHHQQLDHRANHDPLTGLPNRRALTTMLEDALDRRHQRGTAILFLDLDRFKPINDTYGHNVGDEVLVVVVGRLKATVRPTDTVVRYGGDEFVIICPDLTHPVAVAQLVDRLEHAISAPMAVGTGPLLRIGVSVGVVTAGPDDSDAHTLVRRADRAMYQAKDLRRAAAFS